MRRLSLVATVVVTLAAGLGVSSTGIVGADPAQPIPNSIDVNCSGSVDSIDALLVLQFNAGLLGQLACEENADANGDGAVNSVDATLILQFVAGLTFKPGAVSTIEEYFDVFASLDTQFEQDISAAAQHYEGKVEDVEILASEDSLIAALQGFFVQYAEAIDGFADGLNLLPPAPEIEASHHDVITAWRALATAVEEIVDAIGEAETVDEANAILFSVEEFLADPTKNVMHICLELQVVAAAHAIALDLLCATS